MNYYCKYCINEQLEQCMDCKQYVCDPHDSKGCGKSCHDCDKYLCYECTEDYECNCFVKRHRDLYQEAEYFSFCKSCIAKRKQGGQCQHQYHF